MDLYRILPGGSFRLPSNEIKTAGDEIELASDVAAMHAGVLQKIEPAADFADTHVPEGEA